MSLPFTTNGNFYNTADTTSTFEGLGLPTGAGSASTIDANDGKGNFPTGSGTADFAVTRGGAFNTTAGDAHSPFNLNPIIDSTNSDTSIGFRVTCDEP